MPIRLLLIQLLPILVFIAVDALVEEPAWAIGCALGFVAFQTLVTYLKKKKVDPLVLVDAVLIGGLGAASLISDDDLFFKLKPAIIEVIMVAYLGFLTLVSDKILSAYFERYAGGMKIQSRAYPMLRKMLLWMAAWTLLHAGAVILTALFWSRQVWGWISGPGYYLPFVPLLAWVLWRRLRLKTTKQMAASPRNTRAST